MSSLKLVSIDGAPVDLATTQNAVQLRLDSQQAPVLIKSTGVKGDKGDKGDPGAGSAIEVTFAYGDATPTQLSVLSVGTLLANIEVYVYEMFNLPCRIRIYDGLGNTFLDVSLTGELSSIDVSPAIKYSAGTNLYLSLTPSVGQTTGKGAIFIYLG